MKLGAALTEAYARRTDPKIPATLTPEIDKWITDLGEEHIPALLPADVERGPVGSCFDSCLINVVFNTKYQYVEGKTSDPDTGQWIYHAWLTDGKHAFDPTWIAMEKGKEIAPRILRYIGIPIPNAFVMMFVQKTDYQGILGNAHRWPQGVEHMLAERKRIIEEALK